MNRIEREYELFKMFYNHMENNIFYTKNTQKLESEVRISNVFPIYMKNLNEEEIEYIRNNNYKRLFSIVSIFPNLKYLIENDHYFIDDKYYAFKSEIYDIKQLYEYYIAQNDQTSINNAIKDNDIKSFCSYLTFLKEDIVVIEVKNWDCIDEYIMKYYNCELQDVKELEYREYFIKQYMNLFSIINLDLTIFQGINLMRNDRILVEPDFINQEYNEAFSKMFSNPYIIDSFVKTEEQILDLFFIINNFEKNRYMKERKAIVDFVTCLEFLLLTNNEKSGAKLQKQFKYKVRKCCVEMGYNVPGDELEGLYDYRSLIVHGNFQEINNKTKKLTNKKWYTDFMKKDEAYYYYDNSDKEDLIFCRLYKIFNIIFRLYCEKNEVINKLKTMTEQSEIELVSFNIQITNKNG